jgi:protein transport protein DSL1/ZW10
MSGDQEAAKLLCSAIVDGSFPPSEDLLVSDLSSETISALLSEISQTRQDLSSEIRSNTEDGPGNVDQWIAQAKQIQEDIARCKIESRRIVEEHEQLQALKDQATDYERKAELLETEIDFSTSLEQELQNLSRASKSLHVVEECLARHDPSTAAAKLNELQDNPITRSKSRTTILLGDLRDELRLKTRFQLETTLNELVVVRKEQGGGSFELRAEGSDHETVQADSIVEALEALGDGQDSTGPLADKLRMLIIHPLRRSARLKLAACNVQHSTFNLEFGTSLPSVHLVLEFIVNFLDFLRDSISPKLQSAISNTVLPELMDVLVSDWLNPELPTDLGTLDSLDGLKARVQVVLDKLKSSQWGGQSHLHDWMDDIQRAWLNKRKAATLDAVRRAFASAKGNLRQVERVERQVISTAPKEEPGVDAGPDDWEANWDDANDKAADEPAKTNADNDDDTDGWGFDDDEAEEKADKNGHAAEADDDDTGDAWGWGDESPAVEKKSKTPTTDQSSAPNGTKPPAETEREVTLTEVYSISEIPDHLIEIIGRDLSDAQTLAETQHNSLDSASGSRGLLALPTLALAMFRATAPSYYGASSSLTDIHRYNDSLYLADQLRNMNTPPGMQSMESDVKSLEKFAKMAYSKEMETQRIIIWDLLDGAQGFTSCTQFPYSQEIENAVTSVIDRLRTLHGMWEPVLSTSALMQSLGALLTMVISKVIASIEEMDDISEPESQRLTSYCQQIAALEDLFMSVPPSMAGQAEGVPEYEEEEEEPAGPLPMTAVYVSNWLRFQYLINILESSLVDIKYLWTEGELSLEFSADEVVDLVKALFAESGHRRSAIAAIKGARMSRS